ncbi:oxysterol-binding protein 2-like isoform X6 [Heterodontus francisci]|uniref:oxysterol-binding protein 2-like isoform X6 n=1 Tax=Heterodontus francisci TaxID=7792 RepID=UPI00355AD1E5
MGKAAALLPSSCGSVALDSLLLCQDWQVSAPGSQPRHRMSEPPREVSSSAGAALPLLSLPGNTNTHTGWLHKWTNYLKGYQRRWFVLSNGLLSYYSSTCSPSCSGLQPGGGPMGGTLAMGTQAEMGHTCRGTINLATAHIDVEDSCTFVLSDSGHTYHLKASSEVERQRWVTALELAKSKAIRMMSNQSDDSGDEEPTSQSDKSELHATLRALASKLDDLSQCNDLIAKHGAALQRSLSELESLKLPAESGEKIKAVNERATLFRITSNAMINACRDFLDLAETHSRKWQRALQYEREQRIRLEETIEQLAKQHNSLERACRGAPALPASSTEISCTSKGSWTSSWLGQRSHHIKARARHVKGETSDEDEETEYFDAMENAPEFITVTTDPTKHRRTGSNISGTSSDHTETWNLEDHVFECQHQASFSASTSREVKPNRKRRTQIPDKPSYSLNLWSIMKNCIGKELSKIPMPVSHHPPAAAHHVYSKYGWTLWQEITIASKFRGKYLSIMPLGAIHLQFNCGGNHYVWRKVTSTVHNIIVGKLWIDQSGEIEIINNKTKDKCQLKFSPYSYFSRECARKVTGVVTDSEGKASNILTGTWDEKMEFAKVVESSQDGTSCEGRQKTVYQTLPPKVLWRKYALPDNAENMYYFSELALTLNEMESGSAPTDSRLRPDQRLMENGEWEEANVEKQRLEEKQRAVRRLREAEAVAAAEEGREYEPYQPVWFEKKEDPITGEEVYVYKGGYWESKETQDWKMCPDIF